MSESATDQAYHIARATYELGCQNPHFFGGDPWPRSFADRAECAATLADIIGFTVLFETRLCRGCALHLANERMGYYSRKLRILGLEIGAHEYMAVVLSGLLTRSMHKLRGMRV